MFKYQKFKIIDLAPSTNYPVSEKKSTQKEMESINSKKKLNPIHPPVNKTINSENLEGNNIIIDGTKENNNGLQSKCCMIFWFIYNDIGKKT